MQGKEPPGLFIVGTDTEVGKTHVACMIVRHLVRAGLRVGVYKPVASGCSSHVPSEDSVPDETADDAWRLWDAASRPGPLHRVCPQRFAAPLAPHLAARSEGKVVDERLLVGGLESWRSQSDIIIVEGVGGLMSPVSDDSYVADLAWEFDFPLVVVAPNQLGVINQTLQTLITAVTFRDGLEVAGVVLNDRTPAQSQTPDPSRDSNLAELEARCTPPVLAHVRWGQTEFEPAVDWFQLARIHSP